MADDELFCVVFLSRILFKDKDRKWDEIESQLRIESDLPLLKTSNKVQKLVSERYLMGRNVGDNCELMVFFLFFSGDVLNSPRTEEG